MTSNGCCGITRRGFMIGAGAGLAAGLPLGLLGLKALQRLKHQGIPSFSGKPVEVAKPNHAMPGPFPGRVIEVHHPSSVNEDNIIYRDAVKKMMDRGMCELTGAPGPQDAWKRFFERGDVVGVKVNPVGRKPNPGEWRGPRPNAVGSISSPEVLLETVAGLLSAGVRAKDIIVFERYANEFRQAGYEKVMNERLMDGVRWFASSSGYDETQLDIEGYGSRKEDRDPHVSGYDPDVFVTMGFAAPNHDPKDDRRFRSHLSTIVTRMVNKFVTIPVLKDHRSAGVTLALKNLSHGMNNNVARSHIGGIYRQSGAMNNPNQCNTFIPLAVSHQPMRQKSTLHIMDGLIGVYEGGPGCWNGSWGTWQRKSLFFATDPVAMDHVGWDIIDEKRAKEGWQPVSQMSLTMSIPALELSTKLAALSAHNVPNLLAINGATHRYPGVHISSEFDRRTPEHVYLASTIGLGTFDARAIDYRKFKVS